MVRENRGRPSLFFSLSLNFFSTSREKYFFRDCALYLFNKTKRSENSRACLIVSVKRKKKKKKNEKKKRTIAISSSAFNYFARRKEK